MLARRTWLLLLVVAIVFIVGIGQLFVLRFSRGDIYPPYSSLRADPLGGKALYDALDALEAIDVVRNESPIRFLESHPRSTFVYLGVPARYFAYDSELDELGKLALAGHRIIIGLLPDFKLPEEDATTSEPGKNKPTATPRKKEPSTQQWQLELTKIPEKLEKPILMKGLDQPTSFHSGLGFVPKNTAWKTLASVGTTPVLVERPYGLGSLVLLADSYPLSNEALRRERRPFLLATVLGIGRGHTIVFDETHFGVREQPGVATLARRYRLHGVVGVCFFLASLFLWRNLTPFFPRASGTTEKEIVLAGQEAHVGLLSLLRRSVGANDLPTICLQEWTKSAAHGSLHAAVHDAGEVAADHHTPSLERLAKINQLLNPKTHGQPSSQPL